MSPDFADYVDCWGQGSRPLSDALVVEPTSRLFARYQALTAISVGHRLICRINDARCRRWQRSLRRNSPAPAHTHTPTPALLSLSNTNVLRSPTPVQNCTAEPGQCNECEAQNRGSKTTLCVNSLWKLLASILNYLFIWPLARESTSEFHKFLHFFVFYICLRHCHTHTPAHQTHTLG